MTKTIFKNDFFSYTKHYLKPLLLSLAFVYASYIILLIYPALRLDEEDWIVAGDAAARQLRINRWASIGRFGMAALESVFGLLKNFNTRAFDIWAIALYFISAVIFLYAVNPSRKTPALGVFAFLSLYCVLPYSVGELISFSLQNVYMGIGLIFASLAVLCAVKHTSIKKPWFFIGALLLCFCATSFYQSFVTVFITGLMAYALFSLNDTGADKHKVIMRVLWGILAGAAALAVYFFVYKLLTGAWRFGDGRLTRNWVGWLGDDDKARLALIILTHIKWVLAGVAIFAGRAILGIFILFITACVTNLLAAPRKNIGIRFLSMLLLMLSPFFMDMALGTKAFLGRTFTALAPALAGEALFIVITASSQRKILKYAAYAGVCLCLAYNLRHTNNLFYGAHLAYEKDKETAAQIMRDISEAGLDPYSKPVLFVGSLNNNEFAATDNPVAGSYFSVSGGLNNRIHNFFRVVGYDIPGYTKEQFAQAIPFAAGIPDWPAAGSVTDAGPCILVKLSDIDENWLSANAGGG